MKHLLILSVIFALMLGACAPNAPALTEEQPSGPELVGQPPAITSTSESPPPAPTEVMAEDEAGDNEMGNDAPDEEMAEEAPPAVVDLGPPPNRGADLHASDPDNFTIASGAPQLVEFFAFWCSTCRSAAPTVHALEDEYWGQMPFVYLDIDDPRNQLTKEALGFRYQPHFVLLDANGNILQQWVGPVNPDELRTALNSALAAHQQ